MILYATAGCHLCEQAQRIIVAVSGAAAPEVDIAADEDLMARYGTRIPVLQRTDTGAEIGWPFGAEEVRALLD